MAAYICESKYSFLSCFSVKFIPSSTISLCQALSFMTSYSFLYKIFAYGDGSRTTGWSQIMTLLSMSTLQLENENKRNTAIKNNDNNKKRAIRTIENRNN